MKSRWKSSLFSVVKFSSLALGQQGFYIKKILIYISISPVNNQFFLFLRVFTYSKKDMSKLTKFELSQFYLIIFCQEVKSRNDKK